MARNPQKIMQLMAILTVVIGFAAIAVGIVAIAKEEYIIATALILLAAWQVVNYRLWKRKS